MAFGIEIVLGFKYPQWNIIENGLGFKMPRPIEGDPHGFDLFEKGYFDDFSELDALKEYWEHDDLDLDLNGILEPIFDRHAPQLAQAWHAACLEMGWKFLNQESQNSYLYETPLGQRELIPFCFELFYDRSEFEDTPEQAILGIALSGRYFPTFLDWDDRHGGLYNYSIGPKLPKEMEIAIKHINKAFPFFEQADWIIKEQHY